MLLWCVSQSPRLPAELRRIILDANNEIFFSAASVWEIAIKSAIRRRDFDVEPMPLVEAATRDGFLELAVSAAHAARVRELPAVHADPFDRLLVAQSIAEPMLLLTNDALLRGYGSTVKVA